MRSVLRSTLPGVATLACALLVVLGVLALGGCSRSPDIPSVPPRTRIACRSHASHKPTPHPPPDTGPTALPTVSAGTIPGTFSVTSTGEATYTMPLVAVPGRAGVEPRLSLTYNSAEGDGVLGMGFSLGGLSAITRCPSNIDDDGEIRGVRYDARDQLCLDGKRLVPVRQTPGIIEYRTLPDTFVRVTGYFPLKREVDAPEPSATFFEANLPSGLVIEYGSTDDGKPVALGGAPRAWLATKLRDGRGNAMTYSYCTADAEDHTAEVTIDEIRYTSFEGDGSLESTRSVEFVYGTKDPADIGGPYAGGMALQSSLRLDEIQMLGPGDTLVRRYAFTYGLGPTTQRTLLTQVEECAGNGVCKPPTRFQFKRDAPGFKQVATSIPAPTSSLASPMLYDSDGDGLPDLTVGDTDEALSTPQNPITQWTIAKNRGPGASPSYFSTPKVALSEDWTKVNDPSGPSDPRRLQPDVGTALSFAQSGRMDVLLHDVYGSKNNYRVLAAEEDGTFKLEDTGIARPFPLGASPKPPTLTTSGGSTHLADIDGDQVPDLIVCQDHSQAQSDGDIALSGDGAVPGTPQWTVHLWKPAHDGAPAGFAPAGEIIDDLENYRCNTELYTADVDGDTKIDLIVPTVLTQGGTEQITLSTYSAISRVREGGWEVVDTKLPTVAAGGRVVFVDVTGDGLPDAVESGFQDHALRTFLNTGRSFVAASALSLGSPRLGDQDTFFGLAVPIDFNGDQKQDLLMPVPPGTLPTESEALPAWAILQARGGLDGPTFTLVDPHLPFEASLGDAVTLADPRGARIADLNGDGAEDVLLLLGDAFHVFENQAADQDLLIAVSDGMNAHAPTDPAFVPSASISYGHLIDSSITKGQAADDPARESALYLSHADAKNDCAYPRTCAVGPRRVVSGYGLNNGADGQRRFSVRYRDGRYHRLGRGFLGFGERIVTDLDTGAGAADFYDNITSALFAGRKVFPFAGQVAHAWRWLPGLPSQPKPDQIEMAFADVTRVLVPTNDEVTYFTAATEERRRLEEGVHAPNGGAGPTIEAYVQSVAESGGATVLADRTTKRNDIDAFGNAWVEDTSTVGVDLTMHTERTFKNDTDRWVLGQLQRETTCSTAAMLSACRTLERTTTIYGEPRTDKLRSDDNIPDTALDIAVDRDAYGNVRTVTADDAYGYHRVAKTFYEAEGIYPHQHVNEAGHTTFTDYDAGLGVLIKLTDPNQLVTTWTYDGFGRLGKETRPDGTETSVTLARTKDGGPNKDGWRVTARSTTTGGADDTVEVDSLGRPIRWWWHGPDTGLAGSDARRLMQEIQYDALGEHIARRSVPNREGTAEDELLFDVFDYDAAGRTIKHTTPWSAVVETSYDGLQIQVTDPLKNVTVVEQDPLGRPVTVTDAEKGITAYTYGPFGALYTVTDPGNAVTRMLRDAFGRVRRTEDPDRGTTLSAHDGFGELVSSVDALGRASTFHYDALGRPISRLDQEGAASETTTWTWDVAEHGIGALQAVTSADGEKSYTYTGLGQLASISLAVKGESDPLVASLGYDDLGRVKTITYPTPAGAPPFVVAQDYDPYGHVVAVRDDATSLPYWRLTDTDSAGRFRSEVFGNGVFTERGYYPDTQRLAVIITQNGASPIQNLLYHYDARRDLTSRHDGLQPPQTGTERFRCDALQRVKCAYFSINEDPAAPCALSYDYAPDGNLTFKSDVGVLSYDDAAHPHAVTGAGGETFGYDAVGNQIARPGGAVVSYTPFDLPKAITKGASSVTFAYVGDQQRIRKTTPKEETLYLEDLYERVTSMGALTAHRYYVHSPERVVAIVTRGGAEPGTRYVHVDHLGSVDVLTKEDGGVAERRSYDPFGQRRNPIWGQPPPGAFSSETTLGFTGHEADDELGLVNMKGRVFDPKLGRFLTTDPIVQAPLNGQNWNPYSYVVNRPLAYVDPSGFEYRPGEEPQADPAYASDPAVQAIQAAGCKGLECRRPPQPPKEQEGTREAAENGAATRPVDVGTTGNASGVVPQQAAVAPGLLLHGASELTPITSFNDDGDPSWQEHRVVQGLGGYVGGIGLGYVPIAGPLISLAADSGALGPSTRPARLGKAVGEMVGGLVLGAGGIGLLFTGGGAPVGAAAIATSVGMVAAGLGSIGVGAWEFNQAMMSKGSGGTSRRPSAEVRRQADAQATDVDGKQRCQHCGTEVSDKAGSGAAKEYDHRNPWSRSKDSSVENIDVTCRTCNRQKGARTPEEWGGPQRKEP